MKNANVLNGVLEYIFETGNTPQEQRVFDYDLDFKYYYSDFKELGIDLIDDDIDWFRFTSILRKIILNKNSLMSQIIDFRNYEKPSASAKVAESKMHKERMRLKREYTLPIKGNGSNNLEKMWSYIENKARGETNE
jgi:hypothetical protein